MKRVAFFTLGCKLNFAESSGLAKKFLENGYQVSESDDEADVYVINTCTVTALAEKKAKQWVHKINARFPLSKIAVIGCFSELRPEEVSAMQGVDYVLGSGDKHLLIDLLEEKGNKENKIRRDFSNEFVPFYSYGDRTRSFLKIQDGCDNFCTYCAIPYARGRSRSFNVKETLKVLDDLCKASWQETETAVKEVVLTGVNIGDFGKSHGESFLDLIKAIEIAEGPERYRISSIEPDLLTDEIIRFVADSKKFMPHFHIPLQSGSNEILKAMKRKYERELFAERVYKIKELIPDCFIAADVIVGFPTETEALFEETYQFIKSLPLTALHVFSYSSRPEAAAAKFTSVNTKEERSKRSKRLSILSEDMKKTFYLSQIGKSFPVLWENTEDKYAFMYGFTDNYIKVAAKFDASKINTISEHRIDRLGSNPEKGYYCK